MSNKLRAAFDSLTSEDLEELDEYADLVRQEAWDRDTQERARRIRASREKKAEENGW